MFDYEEPQLHPAPWCLVATRETIGGEHCPTCRALSAGEPVRG